MGAAFLAPGEALVDAVAVGLVGDDEDAAVGGSGRGGEQRTGRPEARQWIAWLHRMNEGSGPHSNRPKRLIMINHERDGGRSWPKSAAVGPKSARRP